MSLSPRRRRILLARLLQIAFAGALVALVVLVWQQQRLQVQGLLHQQGQRSVDQLLAQASVSAATAMKADDLELLQWLVENLISQPEVISATVFSYQGEALASAQKLFPKQHLPSDETLQQALDHFTPHTIAVRQQQQAYGYLRLRVNTTLLQQQGRRLHHELSQQLIWLLAVSGFSGFVLARAFSFKRFKATRLKAIARAQRRAEKRAKKLAAKAEKQAAASTD
ncbi:hypothetical protein [Ferrimonas senticii]|uniref:hypothetical protein n=1 Tax=Ferrimonas senticii TaxID=394566 RepID=UPI0004293333|nr:hypothetical protein [Ferrimonas senticii]